jgi:protein O-mannosyl-transferase
MIRDSGARRVVLLIALFIAALTLVVFGSGLRGQMIFDDYRSIVANSDIEHFPDVVRGSTRPLTELTFYLNYALHGASVVPYHVVNIVIHTVAALLLFGVLRLTLLLPRFGGRFATSAPWLAGSVAAVWAVHPLQTESVTYIVQRAESMMGMFALLSLYASVRASKDGGRLRWQALAIVSMGLGMASKPVMVVVPLLVLLYDVVFLEGGVRDLLRQRWRFYLLLASTWLIPAVLLSMPNESSTSAGFGPGRLGSWGYLLTQCDVVVHYLRRCVWPDPLCIDYAWSPVSGWGEVWCTGSILAILLAVTLVLLVRRRPIGFLGAWFFLALMPTSSVLPLDDLAAERRLYLALVAPVTLLVIGGAQVLWLRTESARGRWLSAAVWVAVLATLSVLTVRRNLCYTSETRMWESVLEVRPQHIRARVGLGALALAAGDLKRAEAHFVEVLERLPADVPAGASPTATLYSLTQTNLGVVREQEGRFDLAEACFREAIRVSQGNADAKVNLGILLSRRRQDPESSRLWQAALKLEPHHAKALYCLGWSAMQRGDRAAAGLYLSKVAAGRGPWSDQARALLAQPTAGE